MLLYSLATISHSFLPQGRKHARDFGSKSIIRSYSKTKKINSTASRTRFEWLRDHNNDFLNKQRRYLDMSISQVAGNMSFMLSTAAFLHTDILALRCLASTSGALVILYNYYRPEPLWVPIKWNMLLLAINSTMATALYLERRNAEHMDPQLEELFIEGQFEKRGFDRVEFRRFFQFAKPKPIFLKGGEYIVRQGQLNDTLFFLSSGSVVIQKNKRIISESSHSQFIGELSFLNFMLSNRDHDYDHINNEFSARIVSADAIAGENGVTLWTWDFKDLRRNLLKDRTVSNAFSAYVNHDIRIKLALT